MWYLAGLKMARARKLLTDTSYAIGEIAILCGFPDANYFTRFFHRHEGIPRRIPRAVSKGCETGQTLKRLPFVMMRMGAARCRCNPCTIL